MWVFIFISIFLFIDIDCIVQIDIKWFIGDIDIVSIFIINSIGVNLIFANVTVSILVIPIGFTLTLHLIRLIGVLIIRLTCVLIYRLIIIIVYIVCRWWISIGVPAVFTRKVGIIMWIIINIDWMFILITQLLIKRIHWMFVIVWFVIIITWLKEFIHKYFNV